MHQQNLWLRGLITQVGMNLLVAEITSFLLLQLAPRKCESNRFSYTHNSAMYAHIAYLHT